LFFIVSGALERRVEALLILAEEYGKKSVAESAGLNDYVSKLGTQTGLTDFYFFKVSRIDYYCIQ
jgi:hypothetical protein